MEEAGKRKKVALLFSGGLDSSALLALLVRSHAPEDILPVMIDYGQSNVRELAYARIVCDSYKVKPLKVDMDLGFLSHNAMTGQGDMPEVSYRDRRTLNVVVPNRNMLFLSLLWSVVLDRGIQDAYVAMYAEGDGSGTFFPDTTPAFLQAAEFALKAAVPQDKYIPSLHAPFSGMSKANVVRYGVAAGLDFSWTWSCYNRGTLHCGVCPACVKRKEAFEMAGVEDPTEYAPQAPRKGVL